MHRCLSMLVDVPEEGYSPSARRLLTGGNRVFPHRATFSRADVVEFRLTAVERMSISGVQEKVSLKLVRGALVPTATDGEYILKPVPSADVPQFKKDIPANENLTMQIAAQVFGIATAANACLYMADGELAYITRRFDRRDGRKLAQEDFCQLSNRSEDTAGRNYKYSGSYEEAGRILRQYCKAYAVEIEKLYARIVFNYVFSNGDAHLKNFSLFESEFGDYVMTPAYDLLCTSLHFPSEARTALVLFDTVETESFRANGFYKRADFLKLAEIYGMRRRRAEGFLDRFQRSQGPAMALVGRSFLSDAAKADYAARFEDRLKAILD